jgi:hypothetical protein
MSYAAKSIPHTSARLCKKRQTEDEVCKGRFLQLRNKSTIAEGNGGGCATEARHGDRSTVLDSGMLNRSVDGSKKNPRGAGS